MSGILTIIPTPIDNESPLNPKTFDILKTAHESDSWKIIVEEHKAARRRWLHWGLEKAAIENFILYNEHSSASDTEEIIKLLKKGFNIALMSDAGLPAFCDPGQLLIQRCHQLEITVTSAPFENSIALAMALSGIEHQEFYFAGFLPKEKTELTKKLLEILKNKMTTVLMDTPYRLQKTLSLINEISQKHQIDREFFLAMDLNKPEEKLIFTNTKQLGQTEFNKKEFIMVLGKSL